MNNPEDELLLAIAQARAATDTGRRHSLDKVLAEGDISRAELEREIADEDRLDTVDYLTIFAATIPLLAALGLMVVPVLDAPLALADATDLQLAQEQLRRIKARE